MEELIKSIYDSPEDWTINSSYFIHRQGLVVKVYLGITGLKIANGALNMTLKQRIHLWRAYKWWCTNAPLTAISPNPPIPNLYLTKGYNHESN